MTIYGSPDPYYNPDEFGLTQVAFLDDERLSWEFDMLVVWQDENGRLRWARDWGCSCPSPFEEYTSLDDLTLLNPNVPDQWRALEDAAWDVVLGYSTMTTSRNDAQPRDARRVKEFLRDVRNAAGRNTTP